MAKYFSDKINKQNQKQFPELYTSGPRKNNDLKFLKSCPYRRSLFKYYSNPVIGYKHVLDPSHSKGLPKTKMDIPKAQSVKKQFKKCFPEMGKKGYIE